MGNAVCRVDVLRKSARNGSSEAARNLVELSPTKASQNLPGCHHHQRESGARFGSREPERKAQPLGSSASDVSYSLCDLIQSSSRRTIACPLIVHQNPFLDHRSDL